MTSDFYAKQSSFSALFMQTGAKILVNASKNIIPFFSSLKLTRPFKGKQCWINNLS